PGLIIDLATTASSRKGRRVFGVTNRWTPWMAGLGPAWAGHDDEGSLTGFALVREPSAQVVRV
ncbi:hypothetical protein, partial [Frankia sp. Cas4]|uniref:hypothetical protein n=1 Tax=Frankia sp. Cas4 TaxID=3073927 RepID=UPI002AD2CACC